MRRKKARLIFPSGNDCHHPRASPAPIPPFIPAKSLTLDLTRTLPCVPTYNIPHSQPMSIGPSSGPMGVVTHPMPKYLDTAAIARQGAGLKSSERKKVTSLLLPVFLILWPGRLVFLCFIRSNSKSRLVIPPIPVQSNVINISPCVQLYTTEKISPKHLVVKVGSG